MGSSLLALLLGLGYAWTQLDAHDKEEFKYPPPPWARPTPKIMSQRDEIWIVLLSDYMLVIYGLICFGCIVILTYVVVRRRGWTRCRFATGHSAQDIVAQEHPSD